MRVLLTSMYLAGRTGAELHVAEVARELRRRGHDVRVVATVRGRLAAELGADGIPVEARGPRGWADVIHAQGRLAAEVARQRNPAAPMLFVCHDHRTWYDRIEPGPHIRRYAGVSRLCVNALLEAGAPADQAMLLPNFVDTCRFHARAPLPTAPRRALVFSNYASEKIVSHVRAGCRAAGVELDVIGEGMGRPTTTPESLLGRYDLVFAKGRAAMEALAAGCAVVLCDFPGLGPMVTFAHLDELQAMNFGFEALRDPHDAGAVEARVRAYDAADAGRVSAWVRAHRSLEAHGARLEALYHEILDEPRQRRSPLPRGQLLRIHCASSAYQGWNQVPAGVRDRLRRAVPTARRLLAR